MELADVRRKLASTEPVLAEEPMATLGEFDTPHGRLSVIVTARLRKKCRKGKVWKSIAMLSALKNVAYGFDAQAPRSRGGVDGVFRVDRSFRPANSMMKKLFGGFIDKPDPLIPLLVGALGAPVEEWIPVRLVSHHLRLLGVLSQGRSGALLALVDQDSDKRG